MNILVITSILPLPSAINENDFILHLYGNYRNIYREDSIVIIVPVKYDLNILTILKGKTRLKKLKGKLSWHINNFQIEIYPFFAAWSLRNIHAFVSRSVFYLNRKRINNLFKTNAFDIIHARFIFADGMLAYLISRKYKVPYIVSTHKEMFYFDHFYSKNIAFKIWRNASFVLPVSYINVQYFKLNNVNNVFQVTHGFDNNFIKVQRKQENEKVQILTVSRLLAYKNIDQVVRALSKLKMHDNFSYTLIGKGPEKKYLQNLVNSFGLDNVVSFIDEVPHELIGEEMYKYDIFILPSYFETFGRVYFEAMAMGIPVICAKKSGIYGVFKEKEEGLAVDHRDVDDISNALAFLIENREERLRIGRNGQKLVKTFTWENIAEVLHQKYLESISAHSE